MAPDPKPGEALTPPARSSGREAAPSSVGRARGGAPMAWALRRLSDVQTGHPWSVLCLALVSTLFAGALAARLTLRTSLGELLPENKESVIVAARVAERLPAVSNLAVVAEGSDNRALQRFVDALAPELRAIGPPLVGRVDDGVREAHAFFDQNRFLYAPLDLIREIHDEIEARYDYEVGRRADLLLDDDQPPPPLTEQSIRERLQKRTQQERDQKARYPDGYFLDPETHTAVVLVRTPIGIGDVERTQALLARVREAVARVGPERFDRSMRIGFTGNLITGAEEYAQVKGDLAHVGFWGVVLILGVVFLFYLRLRTLVAMTLTVGVGVLWTFGLAYLLVGHLNTSTGFLVSIVVGNGINFSIIYMARYLEARRALAPAQSAFLAHRETWLGTLAASSAATAAYGSLAVTDFRGFKHFGIIGGTGMLLCWLATYLFLPAILAIAERVRAIKPPAGVVGGLRGLYGRPFAWLSGRAPRLVTGAALALALGAAVLGYRYIAADPLEYNMKNIRNEPKLAPSEARRLSVLVDDIVGRQGQDGLAIVVERLEQVPALKQELDRRKDAAPAELKPFEEVVTVYSLLPRDQEKKIALIQAARAKIEQAHDKGAMAPADWEKLRQYLPPKDLRPIGIEDLPEQVVGSFVERDGTRGRLVYIVPTRGRSVWDGKYLMLWADTFRTTALPDGSVVKGSGHSVVYADMFLAVIEDAPRAMAVSLLATLLIVLLAFRGRASALWVVGSVLMGLCWMLGVLAVWKSHLGPAGIEVEPLRLNFLNFVALPITIGVGADYAVNIMQRYRLAGGGDIRRVVVETGGAVILCSLTTILGYLALTLSINQAIHSFGIAAATGEICCLCAAVLVLPCALVWRARRRTAARGGT
ncbi:MAG: MMPL family transporter [Deltaproteobacteria bacterium]|nr:MMPL family transporter [Deltaproteobacteria bacterium]